MFLLPVVAYGADKITPLNVKTGLWELTSTMSVKGAPGFSEDELKELSPEMRARLEQMWKANQGSKTTTRKTCVTAEQLKKDPFVEESPDCTLTVVTSSSSEINVRKQCLSQGKRTSTSYRIQALTPENVKAALRMEETGKETLDISGEITGRWIAPVCGTVK
jgi:hypothetical protein